MQPIHNAALKYITQGVNILQGTSDKYIENREPEGCYCSVINIYRWKNGGNIMRIDAYMQVNQLYKTNKTKRGAKSEKADTRDSLEISNFGNAYQVAKQAASQGSSVRANRVKEIQAQMAAGTYNVSMEDVADKLADQLLG